MSAFAYGVFGPGVAYAYLERRAEGPGFAVDSLDRSGRRWLVGLGALALVVALLGGAWSGFVGGRSGSGHRYCPSARLRIPRAGNASPRYPGSERAAQPGADGPPERSLAGLLVGPSAGALIHGVLQTALGRVAPLAVAVGGTALAATVVLADSAFASTLTPHEAIGAVVTFGFVLGVASAARRTENLLLPMAAYGLYNVVAVVVGWLSVVARLYLAAGVH